MLAGKHRSKKGISDGLDTGKFRPCPSGVIQKRMANARLVPDVVLMDLAMPDVNGVTATGIIRQRFLPFR